MNTPVMNSEARDSIRKHVQASLEYMENGQLMLKKQEVGKASELIWGSVSQALEALAESRNFTLANHKSLRWFAAELSRETGDKSINNTFYQAEALHHNFHSVDMTVQDEVCQRPAGLAARLYVGRAARPALADYRVPF